MFRFVELSLHGWDVWPPVRIPLDRDVVLLTGPNGSGKTTLLDAIRQLLNAPRLSSRRRLQNYLRRPDAPALIRAVVSNDGAGGAPFRRERITTPEATLACALVPAGSGTPEKRFAVLPGRPPVDDIRRLLLESRDWYGPDRYQRVLEGAGVTRSLMSVLAIEQGRTNALFELKPRELFRRVLEMLGDHAVLERYTEARRRFAESEGEVVRQTSAVQKLELDLRQVERQVAQLDEWEHHRARVAELEARLPAAELQVHLRRRAEASAKLPELRTKVRRGDTELEAAKAEATEAAGREGRTESDLESARRAELEARSAWEAAHGRHVRAADRLAMLESRAREAAELPEGDLEPLAAAAEAASRAFFSAEATATAAAADLVAAQRRIDRLRAGLPVYPAAVTRTLADLDARGMGAALLASAVEVSDPGVGEAAEAALGDARWALLLEEGMEEDSRRAVLDTARRHRFPGPVYAGERLEEDEEVGALRLAAGAPAWLRRWPSEVVLREDGSWQDERGVWVAPPQERVLGQAGREAALAAAENSLAEAGRTAASSQAEVEAAETRRSAAASALAMERRRRDLLREIEALPETREEAQAAGAALAAAQARRDGTTAAREEAHRQYEEALRFRLAAAARLEQQTARVRGEREALERTEAELTAADSRIRELVDRVSPELYARAEQGELDGPDTVASDLDRARRTLEGLGEPPPREVREEALHLRANIDEAERHLNARRREAEEAQAELSECRQRYLEIVSGALQDYRRRAAELAAGAEVAVEMELPRLVDDDRALDEAAIEVRFGFDGKAPLPLGDPSFSGGQQVIAGLVLLMAMAETDGRGFFMLDEPFAHLSLDRVDQVGRFLRAARSQFILTAPTTLDRAQLDPASLVIVLQKKRPGEPHAPAPIVAEA
jgi:energy-coupling factor transporter ATP-binding protein EcfA2